MTAKMRSQGTTRTFSGTLQAGHKQAAVEVPFDPAEAWKLPAQPLWPGRRGHRVEVICGAHTFHSPIVGRSRRHWLLVDDAIRERAAWKIGDGLHITLSPAMQPAT